ncbi:MAG: YfhO family protein [Tatlockia sp.]|nr:YfhO family protein [Tatlockia sp.]
MSEHRYHVVIIVIFFSTLFSLFFQTILFSDRLIVSDGLIPAYFKIPNWSGFLYTGFPIITDPIWNAFYPIRFIIYTIFNLNFNFFIIAGYFLMAVFTYAYVYFITRIPIAACVSAILFSFCGYSIFEIGHAANFIHTLCWLPLILLSFEKLKNTFNFLWFLVGIIAITMTIFGGFPQISFALCFILLTYILLISFQAVNKLKKLGFYLGMISSGYLLASPLIIPTLVLSLHSARTSLSWESFTTYYVELKQLLLFNFPYLMGGYYNIYTKIPSFGNWDIVGNHGYIGFLSLILAGIGIVKRPANLRFVSYYWLFLCILSVLVALGPEINIFYRILFKIPLVNNFRAPERYLFIFSFGISVLAGLGIKAMMQAVISVRAKFAIWAFSFLFASFLLITLIKLYPTLQIQALNKLPPLFKNPAVVVPLGWIAISLISFWYWLVQPRSRGRCLWACLVLISEILYTAYFSYWHPSNTFWSQEQLTNPPIYLNQLRNDLKKTNHRYLPMQVADDPLGKYLWGNLGIYYSLPSAGGCTPLAINRYTDFLEISDCGVYIGYPQHLQDNQAVNIAGIKYFFSSPTPLNEIWFKDSTHFKQIQKIGNLSVYENLKVLPRLWFTAKVINLPSSELLQVIHSGKFLDGTSFDPAVVALVERSKDLTFERDNTAYANIKKISDDEILIKTATHKTQFLVFSDIYYPGWKAYIDGKRTELFLTDYIYRGIIVPAGSHVISFIFRPLYLYTGYIISFLTLCGLIIIYLINKGRARSLN